MDDPQLVSRQLTLLRSYQSHSHSAQDLGNKFASQQLFSDWFDELPRRLSRILLCQEQNGFQNVLDDGEVVSERCHHPLVSLASSISKLNVFGTIPWLSTLGEDGGGKMVSAGEGSGGAEGWIGVNLVGGRGREDRV